MAKQLKLPKRIGGLRIPKSVRKGPIGQFIDSSAGQLLIAEALLAAAGVYTARRTEAGTPTGDAVRHPLDTLKHLGRSAREGTSTTLATHSENLSFAVEQAVRAFQDALERGRPKVADDAEVDAVEARLETSGAQRTEPDSSKKKSSVHTREGKSQPH